ncbi:MAG: glutamate 5-kinase [Candidatus Hydrogenedentes bacterium]|nr:glutamate 5-kinase [Candidatus Hydrogenedentota bacterium]
MNILIVTSGAVGCGMNMLEMTERPRGLPLKQAVAAVGQATLMHYYETLFRTYGEGLHAAQVLLTLGDLDVRGSYLNVRNTIQTLFGMKQIIPILNENDSTAVDQLRFGDNDTLAAKIAAKMNASLLIILSDVDGLYDHNPAQNSEATHIPLVEHITPEIEKYAGGAGSVTATGGMVTKLEAARIACRSGVPAVIANGHHSDIIHGVLAGAAKCTVFSPSEISIPHRKRWIAFGRATRGTLRIDDGARNAILNQGKSLLAAGIVEVEGKFDVGAAVKIRDLAGRDIARALVNYSSQDIQRIKGRKSKEITGILGQKEFDEVVHRDNLVLL